MTSPAYYALHKDEISAKQTASRRRRKKAVNARARELYQRPGIKEKESARKKKAKLANPEKFRARSRTPRGRYGTLKLSAKQRNKEMTISFDEYLTICDLPCTFCNDRMCASKETCGHRLDRIDNDLGYTMSNVIPACGICNVLRGRYLSIEETKVAMAAVLRHRKKHKTPPNMRLSATNKAVGLVKYGRKVKVPWEDIPAIKKRHAAGESCRSIGNDYDVSRGTISDICCDVSRTNPPPDVAALLITYPKPVKIPWPDIPIIKARHKNGETYQALADAYGVHKITIQEICRGKTRTNPPLVA